MSLTPLEMFHYLILLILFLGLAHSFGYLFERFGQPRVIGEIVGGLLMGPTVLGLLWPEASTYLIKDSPTASHAIAGLQELGLLFLMFCSGFEVRLLSQAKENRSVGLFTACSLLIPVFFAVSALPFVDIASLMGTIKDERALQCIFVIAVAVTSIPVISKILIDLDLMGTKFARMVLSVALIEDLILYGVLSSVMAKVRTQPGLDGFLHGTLGIDKGSWSDFAMNFTLTLVLFVLSLTVGPKIFARLKATRVNLLFKGNSTAFVVVVLFTVTLLAIFLGIEPMFGALTAGIIVGKDKANLESDLTSIKTFAFSTFIPLYFAITGFKLDLIHGMYWEFFAVFLIGSSLIKVASVMLGATLQKMPRRDALAYGVALNARGGPGIVLATLTYNAGLINEYFFSALILTALATSMVSGAYLRKVRASILKIA